ncbi:galactoside-binding lectin [Ancylostoma duodenale]|uniref:Galectin n=1 Tax=Ancylostoma duodenale TaxID=51022 RepID=A0A0C2DRV4_9BILA|nr:galactoside-binding lectin [Ancylostoma duodenale]
MEIFFLDEHYNGDTSLEYDLYELSDLSPLPPKKLPEPKFVKEIFNLSTPVGLRLNTSTNRVRAVLKTVNNGHGRFVIDLRNDDNAIVLHFQNKFKERHLIFNSMYRGRWHREERISSPFEYQEVYTIDFIFNGTAPIVYVNGQFLHQTRQPNVTYASQVAFYKDIHVHSMHFA